MFSLSQYLERIQVQGPLLANHESLSKILMGHSCSIPFEHIDVLEGRPISLESDDLFDKLVVRRRGGYCFEQNGLLLRVLEELGFDVTPRGARVRLQLPRDVLPTRTHVFVEVRLGGQKWIVDAGFGGYSLTAPIQWLRDTEQTTPHELRRIVFEEGKEFQQAFQGDQWVDLFEFDGDMPRIDRELGNWWTSANPKSKFKNSLSVGMARPDGTRLGIFNNRFVHRRGSVVLEEQILSHRGELLGVLRERFGLDLPESTSFGRWPFQDV